MTKEYTSYYIMLDFEEEEKAKRLEKDIENISGIDDVMADWNFGGIYIYFKVSPENEENTLKEIESIRRENQCY